MPGETARAGCGSGHPRSLLSCTCWAPAQVWRRGGVGVGVGGVLLLCFLLELTFCRTARGSYRKASVAPSQAEGWAGCGETPGLGPGDKLIPCESPQPSII